MTRIETQILANLLHNEDYFTKVIPFLTPDYFTVRSEKILFEKIKEFAEKYSTRPTSESLTIGVDDDKKIDQDTVNEINDLIKEVSKKPETVVEQWLLDRTEKFCRDMAIYNAVSLSLQILDDKVKDASKDGIPSLLQDALAISFDTHIGHDYLNDAEERYEYYHKKENKVEFDIEMLNKATNGGFSNKTLNVFLAGTYVGKSLIMCHMAAANLAAGKNVLYITLELSEEMVSQRIDANLMNAPMGDVVNISKSNFMSSISKIKSRTKGRLVVKEFPTASAHVGHFDALLNELKLKQKFVPDIVYIDYINICASARVKMGVGVNSYTLVKAISEELRGFAVKHKLPVVSATQTNRGGFDNSDPDMTDTSESFGLPMTADWMAAVVATEELIKLGQYLIKQLKSRYADINQLKKFVIGVDRTKMRLHDVEDAAQKGMAHSAGDTDDDDDDKPAFDKSAFGSEDKERTIRKPRKKDFSNFKT